MSNDTTYTTIADVIDYEIIPAIEAGDTGPEEYDLRAIADDIAEWDEAAQGFRITADHDEFWASVQAHEMPRLATTEDGNIMIDDLSTDYYVTRDSGQWIVVHGGHLAVNQAGYAFNRAEVRAKTKRAALESYAARYGYAL